VYTRGLKEETYTVVGSSVEARARATDVIACGSNELVGSVARSRDLETTLTLTLGSIDRVVVRVLRVEWCGRDVVGVEGAGGCTAWSATGLLTLGVPGLEERRVDTRHFSDEGEGRSRCHEGSEGENGLHFDG